MSNQTIQKRVCDRCGKDFFETYKEWLCRACMNELGWECTPKTNADHIRAMTDEELAEFIAYPCFCDVNPEVDGYRECGNELCKSYLLNWLKQPFKEDEFG